MPSAILPSNAPSSALASAAAFFTQASARTKCSYCEMWMPRTGNFRQRVRFARRSRRGSAVAFTEKSLLAADVVRTGAPDSLANRSDAAAAGRSAAARSGQRCDKTRRVIPGEHGQVSAAKICQTVAPRCVTRCAMWCFIKHHAFAQDPPGCTMPMSTLRPSAVSPKFKANSFSIRTKLKNCLLNLQPR